MAIGNKVFTGMMAGCALALNDTLAHRRLVESLPNVGFFYPDENPTALANGLEHLLSTPQRLMTHKCNAWYLAERKFNWGTESHVLVSTVAELLGRNPGCK